MSSLWMKSACRFPFYLMILRHHLFLRFAQFFSLLLRNEWEYWLFPCWMLVDLFHSFVYLHCSLLHVSILPSSATCVITFFLKQINFYRLLLYYWRPMKWLTMLLNYFIFVLYIWLNTCVWWELNEVILLMFNVSVLPFSFPLFYIKCV